MNYMVGDVVLIRDWQDMEKEYGTDEIGDITHESESFVQYMQKYCGKIMTIAEVYMDGYTLEGADNWNFCDWMIDRVVGHDAGYDETWKDSSVKVIEMDEFTDTPEESVKDLNNLIGFIRGMNALMEMVNK